MLRPIQTTSTRRVSTTEVFRLDKWITYFWFQSVKTAKSDEFKPKRSEYTCIGMLYRFLLADIEEELLPKLVSTSHIGLEWPIQEKKNPKTRIDLLYRLGLADTKETELKQGYRPARIDQAVSNPGNFTAERSVRIPEQLP
ncbi:unnamed protein product [Cochlearia groenlandica]